MRTVTFILLLLTHNVAGSIFSDFQSAITSVGESLGKLVSDVVTDVKETVDCTVMAVERVLAIGGIMQKNPEYDKKCKVEDNTVKTPPDINNKDSVTQSHVETIEIKVPIPPPVENIEENVTNINLSIDCDTDKLDIEKAKEALRNRADHLRAISTVLKQRFDKISEEMKNTIKNNLENDTIALIREIWKELSIVNDLKKRTNDDSEDKTINEVLDDVLGLFKVKETSSHSLNDKIEALRDDLQKEANITLTKVKFEENESKSNKKIDVSANLTIIEATTDHSNTSQSNYSSLSTEDQPLTLHARNILDDFYPDYSEISEAKKRFNDDFYSDYGNSFDKPNNQTDQYKYFNNDITTRSSIADENINNKTKSSSENVPQLYEPTLSTIKTQVKDPFTNKVSETNTASPFMPERSPSTPKLISIHDYILSTTSIPISTKLNQEDVDDSNKNDFDNVSLASTAYPIEDQETTTEISQREILLTLTDIKKNETTDAVTQSSVHTHISESENTKIVTDNLVTTTLLTEHRTLSGTPINDISTKSTAIDVETEPTKYVHVTTASPNDYVTTKPILPNNTKVTTLIFDDVMVLSSTPDYTDIATPIQNVIDTSSIESQDVLVTTETSDDKIEISDTGFPSVPAKGDAIETTTNNPIENNISENTEGTDQILTTTMKTIVITPSTTPNFTAVTFTTNHYEVTTEISNAALEPDEVMTTLPPDVRTTTDEIELTTVAPTLTTISPESDDFTWPPDYDSLFDLPKGEEAKKLVAEAQELMKQQLESAKLMDAVNNAKSYEEAKNIFQNYVLGNVGDTDYNYDDNTDNDNNYENGNGV